MEAFSVSNTSAAIETETAMNTYRQEPSQEIRIWKAKKGQDLVNIIKDWSEDENIPVSWNTQDDYELDYDVFISGTFENALNVLLTKGLQNAPEYKLSASPYHLYIGNEHAQ